MNSAVANSFVPLAHTISVEMIALGFKERGQAEFLRKQPQVVQRLALSLRKSHGENAPRIEVFAGFNFPDIEKLAASLQGKKLRAGFTTCSLNVGLLSPESRILDWPLPAVGNANAVAAVIGTMISKFAVPFWDELATVEKLAAHYCEGDVLVCRGDGWPWRCAAAFALLGDPKRAVDFLQERLKRTSVISEREITVSLKELSGKKGK